MDVAELALYNSVLPAEVSTEKFLYTNPLVSPIRSRRNWLVADARAVREFVLLPAEICCERLLSRRIRLREIGRYDLVNLYGASRWRQICPASASKLHRRQNIVERSRAIKIVETPEKNLPSNCASQAGRIASVAKPSPLIHH